MVCFEGKHSVYFGIGVVAMIVYFSMLAVLVTIYADINPCSKIPFAGPQSKVPIFKAVFKTLIVLFYNSDFRGQYLSYFVGLCAVFSVLNLSSRYRRPMYYKKSLDLFSGVCDSALCWAYICVVVHLVLFINRDFHRRGKPDRVPLYGPFDAIRLCGLSLCGRE